MKSLLPFLSFLFCAFFLNVAHAQFTAIEHKHQKGSGPLDFIENKNQWDESVLFKANFEGTNTVFIQRKGFTFLIHSPEDLEKIHLNHTKSTAIPQDSPIRQHAYKVEFIGSTPSEGKGIAKRSVYHNYFKGKDQTKWAGHVGLYGKVEQQNIYPGINLETYSQKGHLKYDFIVAPNADPSKIKLEYNGLDKIELVEGNLHLHTSLGQIIEMNPIAYQDIMGQRVKVHCYFNLENNVLTYTFPNGYDENLELIIDPTIIASTMTNSGTGLNNLGNWGHSATNDNGGNIFGAGISFIATFPTTIGAFQTNWADGGQDIAIIKYNPNGF